MRRLVALALMAVAGTLAGAVLAAEAVPADDTPPPAEMPDYAALFDVTVVPSERAARVALTLGADARPVRWMRFRADPARYTDFRGDGEVTPGDGFVEWHPAEGGATLSWQVHIDRLRDERSYDARCARRWAVLRGEDLVPTVRVRTEPPARSRSLMRLRLPEGWSAAVPYARTVGGDYRLDDPRRRFDRPQGWFALGDIGVVREEIEDVQVAVAGPTRHGLRRQDTLALLTWALPELRRLFGELPQRLLVVGAGDPMWRGGLSGPNSVFIHADRPLIDEDGTSPILHELIHAIMRAQAGRGGDWIVEGLAELYSLEVLFRSGTLSERRYLRSLQAFEERAADGGKLRVSRVGGATLALAVMVLRELDATLREMTEGARGLDDVVRLLADDPRDVTTSRLRGHAEAVAGDSLEDLFSRHGLITARVQ